MVAVGVRPEEMGQPALKTIVLMFLYMVMPVIMPVAMVRPMLILVITFWRLVMVGMVIAIVGVTLVLLPTRLFFHRRA